jgi:hypothetical protein
MLRSKGRLGVLTQLLTHQLFGPQTIQTIKLATLPDGITAAEFTRQNLDRLGSGKDLVKVLYGRHTYLLPQSSLPGAAPAIQPSGRSQVQNTKAAQAERAAKAQAKRDALDAKRAEAAARIGRPRKTRAD